MLANWVKCTTTTTGTGDLTLTPVLGFPSFADVFSIGQIVAYSIINGSGEPVEEGVGSYSAADTLARTFPCATYVSGVYDVTAPSAVSLSGTNTVVVSSIRGMAPTLPQINTAAAARYYSDPAHSMSLAVRACLAGDLWAIPMRFDCGRPIDAFALEVTTLGTGAVARVGLYSVGANGLPGNLIVESANIDCSTTGIKVATFDAVSVPPGWYYMLLVCKTAGVSFRAYNGGNVGTINGTTPLGQAAFNAPYTSARVAGWNNSWTSMPTTAPTGTWTLITATAEYAPAVQLRLVS